MTEISKESAAKGSDSKSQRAGLPKIVAGAGLVVLLAAAVRALGLGQEALHDELYHFLAAKNYLAEGTLSINGGEPYTRARPFTLLVAWTMERIGSTLELARLPALVAGSALAGLVFGWLRAHGEKLAAWIAGLLICLDPLLIELSQIVRFYSLQHLAFAGGAIGLFEAYRLRNRLSWAVPLGLVSLGLLFAAFHLQTSALIGIAGIGLAALVAGTLWVWNRVERRRFYVIALGVLSFAVVGFAFVAQTEWFERMFAVATQVDRWQQAAADDFQYYYAILIGSYAPLWSLIPLLFVLGFRRRRGIVFYCATIFAVGFLTHSFLPRKAQRYFVYLLPFLFVVFGVGIAGALPYLRQLGSGLASYLDEHVVRVSPGGRRVVAAGVAAAVLGTAAIGNHAFLETYRLASRDHSYSFPLMGPFDGTLSWERAAAELKAHVGPETVVISTDGLKTLYYLGTLDYVLNRNKLSLSFSSNREFLRDPRTNRPIVSTVDSLDKIQNCHAEGLIVAQRMSWNNTVNVPTATADFVAENTKELEVPAKWGMKVFKWSTEDVVQHPECHVTS